MQGVSRRMVWGEKWERLIKCGRPKGWSQKRGNLFVYNRKRFKYLGSMLTEDGRCTCEIKSRIAMAKAAFNKKKNLFTGKLDLNLRKKPVKCYIWSMVPYGAEIWTLWATDQKRLESYEMWCWRRMEKINWTDHVRNEEVIISDIKS